jgi:soluble lytic murein transglycosylase-like protein
MSLSVQFFNKTSLLRDGVVFSVTVFVCSFWLATASMLGKPSGGMMPPPLPELALPRSPESPALLPESATVASRLAAFKGDSVLAVPDAGLAAENAATVSLISSTADRSRSREIVPFQGIIMQVAGRYQVDPYLVRAIIFAESGFNPKAKSKKGARGLMQLMPSTAKALGVRDIYDPRENIDGGVRYFRLLLDRFGGDVQLALAAYNAGSRHVRDYEGVPPFKATRRYIEKVLKFQEKFKMQNRAGFRRLA